MGLNGLSLSDLAGGKSKLPCRQGLNVRPDEVDLVLQAVNPAVFEAKKRLIERLEFRHPPDPVRQQFPERMVPADRIVGPGEPVSRKYSILEIFDHMSRERGHSRGTRI